MVKCTLKILQHLLQDFYSAFDHFGTLCIKGSNSNDNELTISFEFPILGRAELFAPFATVNVFFNCHNFFSNKAITLNLMTMLLNFIYGYSRKKRSFYFPNDEQDLFGIISFYTKGLVNCWQVIKIPCVLQIKKAYLDNSYAYHLESKKLQRTYSIETTLSGAGGRIFVMPPDFTKVSDLLLGKS